MSKTMARDDQLECFRGVLVPLITPFKKDGSIDETSLERLVNFVSDEGANGILVNGTTAEFMHLNYEQILKNMVTVIVNTPKSVFVVAHITDSREDGNLDAVLDRTKNHIDDAVNNNAAAVLVCPYYYDAITDNNIVDFMLKIADYSKIPVFIYNNPAIHQEHTPHSIPLTQLKRLQGHPNIIGAKDSSNDLRYFRSLLSGLMPSFRIFKGSEKFLYDIFRDEHVPYGIVSGIANLAPRFVRTFYDRISENGKDAQKLQRRMDRACELFYGREYEHIIAGIKYGLYQKGIISTPIMADGSFIEIALKTIQSFNRLTET